MGQRVLKRVPLDFDWPIDKIWKGYLNPRYDESKPTSASRTKPSDKQKKKAKRWKEYEPPKGPGYQLWETCSEGSPVSPVFPTAEKLADWCAENETIFSNHKTSKENWLKFFTNKRDLIVGSTPIIIGPDPGKIAHF